MCTEQRSVHPYEACLPEHASGLIVGTIPPWRFCTPEGELRKRDVNFYYGSEDNAFWKLISEVTGKPLHYENSEEAVEERKELLRALRLGITDMIESCVHRNRRADDASLADIRQKNLRQLLSEHPGIGTLIYTSQFVIKQVNQIADHHRHAWRKPSRQGSVEIGGKKYQVLVLYSPSPNALRAVSRETRLAQYRSVFGNKCLK